jgi:hypothetical protein
MQYPIPPGQLSANPIQPKMFWHITHVGMMPAMPMAVPIHQLSVEIRVVITSGKLALPAADKRSGRLLFFLNKIAMK